MKLILILAVTTLLAVNTVQALSIQQEQEILKQVALLQEALEEERRDEVRDDRVVATATNGSESSILQELHLNNRVRIQSDDCDTVAGPYGGKGGDAFQELQDECNAVITGLTIRAGNLLDSIQMDYRTSNGQTIKGEQYGGRGGNPNRIDLRTNQAEQIIAVFGASGDLVDRVGFVTNHGRVLGPYGGSGGNSFSVYNCILRGIFGRGGNMIDSIGFYCKK